MPHRRRSRRHNKEAVTVHATPDALSTTDSDTDDDIYSLEDPEQSREEREWVQVSQPGELNDLMHGVW